TDRPRGLGAAARQAQQEEAPGMRLGKTPMCLPCWRVGAPHDWPADERVTPPHDDEPPPRDEPGPAYCGWCGNLTTHGIRVSRTNLEKERRTTDYDITRAA